MTGRKSWIMIMISFAHKTQRALNGHWTCKYWLLTPESQPLALVVSGRGPLASLCRCQKCRRRNKTQRSRSRSGGDKSLIWSRHGPWPVIVDITQAQFTVQGSENSLTPDTPLVGGGGGCGNIVTVSETLRRIQKRRPGENVRHNSIHQPLASCLRVRMQVVMRPWGGWCITWSTLGSLSQYPCLSVHQRAAAGKWANSQLTIEQSFFIGPGFRNFIFFFFSTHNNFH